MTTATRSTQGRMPAPDVIQKALKAAVQIVALKKALFGNMQTLWTGSGTIVDPSGIILTNCHVANPRALGMPSPDADALGIAILTRSDEPPALTYLAEIAALSPELDLAVLRIKSDTGGRPVGRLNLPFIELGDSDQLDLADALAIFGFPGIGGDTVTFTSGNVSGFTGNDRLRLRRAWIKTDATIAGGNSGGTAVNNQGLLVGVPTQAAAGDNIVPVDARPVVDTNRDGRVDHRDTVMAIGGFINGLRPINVAKPLLRQAGVTGAAAAAAPAAPAPQPSAPAPQPAQPASPSPAPRPAQPAQPAQPVQPAQPARPSGPRFAALIFSTQVTRDGRPINPSAVLPSGSKNLHVTFDFAGMGPNVEWGQVWSHNSRVVLQRSDPWQWGESGRQTLTLSNAGGLPDGEYHLALTIARQIVGEGRVTIGRAQEDNDTQISGQVLDARTNRPIKDALVIALKPNVKVNDFVRLQSRAMAQTSTRSDAQGNFTFPEQLPKGQAYGLIVVARGYRDLAVEGGLRVAAQSPEYAQIGAIPLQPE